MTRGLQKLAIIIEWAVAKSHNGTPSGRPLRSPNRGIFLRAESYSKQCCQFEFIAAQRRIRRGRPVKASRYALRVSRSVVVSLSLLRRSRICIQENAGRRSQFAKPCLIDQLHILADCSLRDAFQDVPYVAPVGAFFYELRVTRSDVVNLSLSRRSRIRRGRPVKASRYALRGPRSVVVSLSLSPRSRI